MSDPLYLPDTDVCIDLLRMAPEDIPASMRKLKPEAFILSSIVLVELETGVQKSARPKFHPARLRFLVGQMTPAVFDADATRHYGEIRSHLEKKGIFIGPLDLLIAAHARSLDAMLITGNLREFKRVPKLRCLPWAR